MDDKEVKIDPSHELPEPEGLKPDHELPPPEGILPEHELPSGEDHPPKPMNSPREEFGEKHLPRKPFSQQYPWMKFVLALTLIAGIAIFFYLLTDQIFKHDVKMVPPSSPTPTVANSGMSNWKTYKNDAFGFEIKYPPTYQVVINDPNGKKNPSIVKSGETYAAEGLYIDWNPYYGMKGAQKDSFDLTITDDTGVLNITKVENGKSIYFACQFNVDMSEIDICNQILSTFKLISPTCTPRPPCLDATPRCMIPETPDMCPPSSPTTSPGVEIMCTMDAKLCPDGTSVGRIPPNCQFAPCPGN